MMMDVRYNRWIMALIGALVFHGFIYFLLLNMQIVSSHAIHSTKKVSIRLVNPSAAGDSAQRSLRKVKKNQGVSESKDTQRNQIARSLDGSTDRPFADKPTLSLKQLNQNLVLGGLSDSTDNSDLATNQSRSYTLRSREHHRYGKLVSPEVQASFDQPTSDIYVPFLWRDANRGAKATAVVERRNDTLWLSSLTGEPMLRAILYEHLQRGDLYKRIVDYLNTSRSLHYTLELHFSEDLDSPQGNATDVRVFEKGLVIIKNRPTLMRQYPGVSLPDAHKERGDARERLVLTRLRSSPAYMMVLEDLPILVRR
jgi:hypothetical protein